MTVQLLGRNVLYRFNYWADVYYDGSIVPIFRNPNSPNSNPNPPEVLCPGIMTLT